jgi:type III pantothenate kinase
MVQFLEININPPKDKLNLPFKKRGEKLKINYGPLIFGTMNLTIDQGNSSTKLGFFDKGELIATYKLFSLDKKKLNELTNRHPPDNVIISSVAGDPDFLIEYFKQVPGKLVLFDHQTPIPIENKYQTPQTLGKDRLAAVVGGITLYPGHPLLVIDAGTAITYDLVVNNAYMGGNISPGLQMRFKALNQHTRHLPLLKPGESPFWGTTTEEAILSGVRNSIIMEFNSYIKATKDQYPDVKIIITGGDAIFFASYTKNIIFVHSNIVLSGLNRIIEYNA